MTKKTPQRAALRLYKSYVFVEKDPVIDLVRTIIADSGYSHARVSQESNVHRGTLRNWFGGKTRRPQFATIAAVVRSVGGEVNLDGRRLTPPRLSAATRRKLAKLL